MRVHLVDPSAFTLPYDHALASALAEAGAEVDLVTGPFPYGETAPPDGYRVRELFYRRARGAPGSRRRRAAKLLEHLPDMLAYRRQALAADVVHFQWLPVQPLDRHLLPARPTVLTAHDLLPREPRPFQVRGQRRLYDAVDAVVVHSAFGRRQLVERLGVDPGKVRVIHHGAFDHLTRVPSGPLPAELSDPGAIVVMFFGLLRPYKGIEVLLAAWRELTADRAAPDALLWIVGRPRMPVDGLVAAAPPGVSWALRFVSDPELVACFRRADVIVLPYLRTERFDFSGVLAAALAFGKPAVLSDIGGFGEVAQAGAAELVPPGQPAPLADALRRLVGDRGHRERLARGARAAAQGPYSWAAAAERTLSLYGELAGVGAAARRREPADRRPAEGTGASPPGGG
jgi:glycosyltransferase involved in cell wall biosynthesis